MSVDFNITSRTAPEPRAQCAICQAWMPIELILGHLRGAHNIDATPAEWPDGKVVIIDSTLQPSDFGDAAA